MNYKVLTAMLIMIAASTSVAAAPQDTDTVTQGADGVEKAQQNVPDDTVAEQVLGTIAKSFTNSFEGTALGDMLSSLLGGSQDTGGQESGNNAEG